MKFGTKMRFGVENSKFKLIRSHSKIDVETIFFFLGGGGENFRFQSTCLLVKMKISNFSAYRVHNLSHTSRWTTSKRKE